MLELACSVCFGAEGPMIDGIVKGMMVLIAVVGIVLFGIASFFFSLMRKEKRLNKMVAVSSATILPTDENVRF